MNYKVLSGTMLASALLLGACGSPESEKLGTSDGKIDKTEKATEKAESSPAATAEKESVSDVTTKDLNMEEVAGPIKYKIIKIGKANFDPNANQNIMLFDGEFEEGEKVGAIYAEFELENTVDEPMEFYLSQSTIITDTGEQIDASLAKLDGNLQDEMKGKVKSRGSVIWQLKNSDIDEVKSFKLITPNLMDKNFNEIVPEKQIELKF